ncbi:hypothetical protein AWENTII_000701 [Aspergillus wentii]
MRPMDKLQCLYCSPHRRFYYRWILLGVAVIVEALERRIDFTRLTAREESNVSAAAQYFILASKEFLYNPFRNADKQNNPWVTGWGNETQLWTGERGFNMERWNFWKSQWGALRVREELSDDAREAARRAEVAMDKAERQKER